MYVCISSTTAGHLFMLSVPGAGGAFPILSRPRDGVFVYPGVTPGHLTHVHMVLKPWSESRTCDRG